MKFIECLERAVHGPAPCTVIIDYDRLFGNEELIEQFERIGVRIFFGGTQLDVRILAETVLADKSGRSVILVRRPIEILPDLAHMLSIRPLRVSDFFPLLSPSILSGMPFQLLSELFIRQDTLFEHLSDSATIQFILESLYGADTGNLDTPNRALAALLEVVMDGRYPGDAIWKHLSAHTSTLPLSVPSDFSDSEGWDRLFKELLTPPSDKSSSDISSSPPIKKVLALYRLERLTQKDVSGTPLAASSEETIISRMVALANFLEEMDDTPTAWADLGTLASEIKLWSLANSVTPTAARFSGLERRINERFQTFLDTSYTDLSSRSPFRRPYIVSQILPFLSYHDERPIVLVVIDGLNLWQARLLIDHVRETITPKLFTSVFAWLPTITVLSRQSICRGDSPDPSTSLYHEENMFRTFWQNQGYGNHEIAFMKGNGLLPADVSEFSGKRIAGVIELEVDSILHGMVLGSEQLLISSELFLKKRDIAGFIDGLCEEGFSVYITADHGNVEATGSGGFPSQDKVVTASRGTRQIDFRYGIDLDRFVGKLPPGSYRTSGTFLFLKDETAFIPENTTIVTHGGSHFWEVLVPFMEFSR